MMLSIVDQAIILSVALVGAALLAHLHSPATRRGGTTELFLRGPWLPLTACLATVTAYGWVWGHWPAPPPIIHDEAAYLFQAEVFGSLRWAAFTPPIPGAFEQFHVLVEPTYASKYPPGHSILLALGTAVGLPVLPVLLLNGLSGGLLVALCRRLAGAGAALVAWAAWLGSDLNLQWRPTYLSQVTTGAAWLLGWYFLLRWRDSRKTSWLVCLALTAGWIAITRPFTALIFMLPISVLVLQDSWRRRQVQPVLVAALAGAAVVLILPVWAQQSTGDWREWPTARYTADYLPFDRLGFGPVSTPAVRQPPAQMQPLFDQYRSERAKHTLGNLPKALASRTTQVVRETWSGWRLWLLPAAILGIVLLGNFSLVFAATAGLHVIAHGLYYHPTDWTVYYLELGSIAALWTGAGVWWLLMQVSVRWTAHRHIPDLGTSIAAMPVLVAGLVLSAPELVRFRHAHAERAKPHLALARAVNALPPGQRIVIIRAPEGYVPHDTFVRNHPDLVSAESWFIHEDPRHLIQLMKAAPSRSVYLLDLATSEIMKVR